MSKSNTFLCSVLFLFIILGYFPAGAQDHELEFKVRLDLAPGYGKFIPGQLRLDDLDDFAGPAEIQDNGTRKDTGKKSRLNLNFSRIAPGGNKVDPFGDDKFSKWNMLKSLPGDFATAQSYQERLGVVGKIFEPKVTLDIEF